MTHPRPATSSRASSPGRRGYRQPGGERPASSHGGHDGRRAVRADPYEVVDQGVDRAHVEAVRAVPGTPNRTAFLAEAEGGVMGR